MFYYRGEPPAGATFVFECGQVAELRHLTFACALTHVLRWGVCGCAHHLAHVSESQGSKGTHSVLHLCLRCLAPGKNAAASNMLRLGCADSCCFKFGRWSRRQDQEEEEGYAALRHSRYALSLRA